MYFIQLRFLCFCLLRVTIHTKHIKHVLAVLKQPSVCFKLYIIGRIEYYIELKTLPYQKKKKSENKILMISAKEDSVGPFRDIHYVDCKLSIDYTVFYYYRFLFFFFPIVDMFVEKQKLKLKG